MYESHRPHSSQRDQFGPAHREYRTYPDESRESNDRWPSQQQQQQQQQSRDERESGYDQPYSAAPTSAISEEHPSPDGDDRSALYSGHYTPEQRRDGIIQSDPKKRKRNFSNRTKTGCLTCRKRKKKCDEAKPECKPLQCRPAMKNLSMASTHMVPFVFPAAQVIRSVCSKLRCLQCSFR